MWLEGDDFMKKLSIMLLAVILIFCFTACGGKKTESLDESNSEPATEEVIDETVEDELIEDSIEGKWEGKDNGDPYYLYIEDGKALMEFFGESYTGTINEDNMEMTFTFTIDGESKETIFDYETIGGQLVLSVDPEKNPGRNADVYSYTRVED